MSLFIINGVLVIAFFVISGLFYGGGFDLFFTPSVLIIMVIFPLLVQLVLYGKLFGKALSVPFKKSASKLELNGAYSFFKTYGQTIWVTAITTIALFILTMMRTLEDKSGLGPAYKLILDTILYAGLLTLIIVLPYKVLIKKKVINYE
ncbi:hypothetical protein FACS189485_14240 [Spirochaetia bacterium]|nr:hypothetical protein FACS189485_14240 [Spirochaetia bacterium]